MENGNVAGNGRGRTALIRNAARSGKWLIPIAALAAIALSLLRLNLTPEGWQSERVCAAVDGLGRLVPDPVVCIGLASLMLIYWGAREREDAAALLGTLAGWLTGIPGMAVLARGAVKGGVYMFATIKRKSVRANPGRRAAGNAATLGGMEPASDASRGPWRTLRGTAARRVGATPESGFAGFKDWRDWGVCATGNPIL